jgi:hypothetical protein
MFFLPRSLRPILGASLGRFAAPSFSQSHFLVRPASGARARRFAARVTCRACGAAQYFLFSGRDGPDGSSETDQGLDQGFIEVLEVVFRG